MLLSSPRSQRCLLCYSSLHLQPAVEIHHGINGALNPFSPGQFHASFNRSSLSEDIRSLHHPLSACLEGERRLAFFLYFTPIVVPSQQIRLAFLHCSSPACFSRLHGFTSTYMGYEEHFVVYHESFSCLLHHGLSFPYHLRILVSGSLRPCPRLWVPYRFILLCFLCLISIISINTLGFSST